MHESMDETTQNEFDGNYCLACNTSACEWKPLCDVNALTKCKKELYSELTIAQKHQGKKTIRCTIARSMLNRGESQFVPSELIKELSDKIEKIEKAIKLCSIDEELHAVVGTVSKSVMVQSIHGFPTTVSRENAVSALEFQHCRLIASAMAAETIESILNWMLEGWYFGQCDNSHNQIDGSLQDETPSFEERGTLRSKANNIQLCSDADTVHSANAKKDNDDDLNRIETSLWYGIFCLTFMYFRALHLVHYEKETWSGANNVVTMAKRVSINPERMKIIEEARNAELRQTRLDDAMKKARRGEEKEAEYGERTIGTGKNCTMG